MACHIWNWNWNWNVCVHSDTVLDFVHARWKMEHCIQHSSHCKRDVTDIQHAVLIASHSLSALFSPLARNVLLLVVCLLDLSVVCRVVCLSDCHRCQVFTME